MSLKLLRGRDHYEELVSRELPRAKVAVWIATANLKDLHLEAPLGSRARARGRMMSALELLGSHADAGVEVRILHARAPSGPFARRLASRTRGLSKLLLRECPRVHMKVVAIDGRLLYLGSANFTGAGLGARAMGRRNFELGVLTDDDYLLDAVQAEFDAIWSGRECQSCKLRAVCPRPIDTLKDTVSIPAAALPSSRSSRRIAGRAGPGRANDGCSDESIARRQARFPPTRGGRNDEPL